MRLRTVPGSGSGTPCMVQLATRCLGIAHTLPKPTRARVHDMLCASLAPGPGSGPQELHAAIREAKSVAASLCEPLTLEEKQALAATIQVLVRGWPLGRVRRPGDLSVPALALPPNRTHGDRVRGEAEGQSECRIWS